MDATRDIATNAPTATTATANTSTLHANCIATGRQSHSRRCWSKNMAATVIDAAETTASHKPQHSRINYKNRYPRQSGVATATCRRNATISSHLDTVGRTPTPTMGAVSEVLKIICLSILLFCVLNTPHTVSARKPTSQELNDYDDAIFEVQKRSEQEFGTETAVENGDIDNIESDDVNGTLRNNTNATNTDGSETKSPTDFEPRFKNSKYLPNILSKPSGSYIQLSCPATGRPEPTITWTLNDTKISRHMGRVRKVKWGIHMADVVPEDSGIYKCRVCNYLGCIEHATKLIISDRVNHKPIILKAPMNLTLALNASGNMECVYLSDLHSKKTWTFTPCNKTACSANTTFLKNVEDVDILNFTNVTPENEGWYTCVEMNGLGQSHSSAYLRIQDPSVRAIAKSMHGYEIWGIVAVMVLLALVCIIFFVYVLRKVKHEKLLKQRIETVHQWTKKVIIYKPPSGDSSGSMDTMIMPVVKIEKQRTTVLQSSNSEPAPFNEYEFPLDSNWEIPRSQLILGATLGEGAFGRVVMAEVNNSIVAVKMVKEGHTDDDIASLVREMEVMKIIGKHINIINLLGCCSQSGPLYVIVEFAPHGNLKDFLNKNRPLAAGTLKDYGDQQHQLPLPKHHLTEKHLISFAFQIARGMEYLASRRCIHRDLAARNVLVSDDYVMKIADFGLARDIQDTDYYRKNTNGRLPIKWMAPESLRDKFYDSQSDVWSYGILLWEIMTFGAQPYPTIMSAEELYSYLMSGQRMDKPPKCSLNIYMLMRQCWHFDASARPTFAEIVENLDKLLLANEDYLDVAVANLETPPSSSDDESDVESLRYHYK
ncbi:fibroblast growth factor receptor homolog 1 [Bactrocera dorsalis]|uniref:receptor protein-tyrosine kinase n=1 Tax=Bactrocera dorsalis TaxID=27457 RepID=A0A6I9W0E9_BACDO|nr:fibroblast growth factor receptor homolog 1 [Bactrocera dorsalis]XP_029408157.2 fibroblast growth factor receptor homolog 1 [Bactrocera dorsalis]XP_049303844.1 fibroblast growth factor receptor homolog 1 [Bactrocera dorsalis]